MANCLPIINKINMGCGASNNQQPVIHPASELPTNQPKTEPVAAKNEVKKSNNEEASLRGSNLNASSTGKPANSKSVPKNLTSSARNEKSPEKNVLTTSRSSLKEQPKNTKEKGKSESKSIRESTGSLVNVNASPSKNKVGISQIPEDNEDGGLRGTKSKKKKAIDPKLQEFMKIYGV